VTNASGTVVETLDYYPYGGIRIDNSSSGVNEARKYIGQQYDAATQLSYLQSRYYSGAQGQFISQDPVFLALGNPYQLQQLGVEDQSALLTNPQSLNAYGYSNDNPITNKDPNGRFIPEALIGAGIGGVVGIGFQAASDLFITHQVSSFGSYLGAFSGGAVYGGIIGATDGASLLVQLGAGAAAGAVQSGVTQGYAIANGTQKKFNYGNFAGSTILSAGTAFIPGLNIEGVSVGQGSYEAIENQIYTKLSTQQISATGISASTFGKMTVSTAAQQAPGAAVQAGVTNYYSIVSQLQSIVASLSAIVASLSSSHK